MFKNDNFIKSTWAHLLFSNTCVQATGLSRLSSTQLVNFKLSYALKLKLKLMIIFVYESKWVVVFSDLKT